MMRGVIPPWQAGTEPSIRFIGPVNGVDHRRGDIFCRGRTTNIRRHNPGSTDILNRLHQHLAGGILAEMVEHLDSGQKLAIGLAIPLPVISKAEPWIGSNIEEPSFRINIGCWRNARAAGQRPGKIRQNIGVQICRHNGIQRFRMMCHPHCHGIDEDLVPGDIGEFFGNLSGDFIFTIP